MNWLKQKTTWTGIAGIVAALGGFFTGEISGATTVGAVIAALSIIFLRQGVGKVGVLLLAIAAMACSAPGTGGEVSPNTATTTTGGYVGAGAEQRAAGATYLIVSRGTTYNIDTDGSPQSEAAVAAIAEGLKDYDETLAALREELKGAEPDDKAALLAMVKAVGDQKLAFMQHAKGAFGVNIHIEGEGEGHGSSTVDTAGTTGQDNAVPPKTDVPPPEPDVE